MYKTLIVAELSGGFLLVNSLARQFLESSGYTKIPDLNLFNDLLMVEARKVFGEIEKGGHEIELRMQRGDRKSSVRIQWMPEADWLVVEIENRSETRRTADPVTQLTTLDLLQAPGIKHRNPPA